MSTNSQPAPAARRANPTVVPYIAVLEAQEVIDFITQAFGATGSVAGTGSAGGIHGDFWIGDALLMIGGGPTWKDPKPRPTELHLYVDDCDATYARAIAAGGTSVTVPADQPYGDREATVRDVAGNTWYIAKLQFRERPAGLRDLTWHFHPRGAVQYIDFLTRAFGAQQGLTDCAPDGTIRHAQVKIGDTCIELGEAHDRWQPMPTAIFLTVENCDEAYEEAVKAGAKSDLAPQDMPFGFRCAFVSDAQGNTWYLSAPLKK